MKGTFAEAQTALDLLGVPYNREYEYRKREDGPGREPHPIDVFRNVYLPLTAEMWCSLVMNEGDSYVGGCCGAMSHLQDLVEHVFRFDSGWVPCQKLEEMAGIILNHGDFEGKVPWAVQEPEQLGALVQEYDQNDEAFDPWDRIALCWQLVRDHYAPEPPRAYGAHLSEVEKAVSLLHRGVSYLSWDHFFAKEEPEPQHAGNRLFALARILPPLRTLYHRIEELSPGDFEGFALFDKESEVEGVEAIATNGRGLCVFPTREAADEMMALWRRQEAEYEEERKDKPVDERIEVRPVRVSLEKGIELI